MLVSHILAKLDYLDETIGSLSEAIDEVIRPFETQIGLLVTIPGVERRTAEELIAEIGVDMDRFRHRRAARRRGPGCARPYESAGDAGRPGATWAEW